MPASKSPGITVEISERDYKRAMARLSKYEGRPFKQRMEAAVRTGVGLARGPMQSRAPVGPAHTGLYPRPGGLTRKSISVRKRKPDVGFIVRYGLKPRAAHSHFASKGVKPHSLATKPERLAKGASQYILFGGRVYDTRSLHHPGSRANPFIEDTIRSHEREIIRFISNAVAHEGVNVGSLVSSIRSF